MKKKYVTESISFEIEIGDDARLKHIDVVEINPEIFPPLAVDDKTKMILFTETVATRLKEILRGSIFLQTKETEQQSTQRGGVAVREGEGKEVECPHCGRKFQAKKPCRGGCNGRITTEICHTCQKPVRIEWE